LQLVIFKDDDLSRILEVFHREIDSEFSSIDGLNPEFKVDITEKSEVWRVCSNSEVMEFQTIELNIDWSVCTVVVTHSLEGFLEESSGQVEFGSSWDFGSVEPSGNWMDFKNGVKGALNSLLADESLH